MGGWLERGGQITVVRGVVIWGDLHGLNSAQAIPNRLPTTDTRIIMGNVIKAAVIIG
jgi:hypothetical protein